MALDIKEVVATLECGEWCSLTFITANVKKGTGGKVIHLPKSRIARRQPAPHTAAGYKSSASHTGKQRDANHNFHFTRNVELPNHRIITVHAPLITKINNESVL